MGFCSDVYKHATLRHFSKKIKNSLSKYSPVYPIYPVLPIDDPVLPIDDDPIYPVYPRYPIDPVEPIDEPEEDEEEEDPDITTEPYIPDPNIHHILKKYLYKDGILFNGLEIKIKNKTINENITFCEDTSSECPIHIDLNKTTDLNFHIDKE